MDAVVSKRVPFENGPLIPKHLSEQQVRFVEGVQIYRSARIESLGGPFLRAQKQTAESKAERQRHFENLRGFFLMVLCFTVLFAVKQH